MLLHEGSPVAFPDAFSRVNLDNLLARAVVEEATGGRGLADHPRPYRLPVPLRCLWSSPDGLPLFASTVFTPAGESADDTVLLHKRAPEGRWSRGEGRTGRLSVKGTAGRWMERRHPLPVTVADAAGWEAWCWGDAGEVARLLSRIAHVGKRRSSGLGAVREWRVERVASWLPGAADLPPSSLLVRAGRLTRPVPAACAGACAGALGLAVAEPPSGRVGWTPPQWKTALAAPGWPAGVAARRVTE
jgi:hypothetical protein